MYPFLCFFHIHAIAGKHVYASPMQGLRYIHKCRILSYCLIVYFTQKYCSIPTLLQLSIFTKQIIEIALSQLSTGIALIHYFSMAIKQSVICIYHIFSHSHIEEPLLHIYYVATMNTLQYISFLWVLSFMVGLTKREVFVSEGK